MTATPENLDLLLAMSGTIDADRATLLISLALGLAGSIVSPVPDPQADVVILGMAARAYLNPAGVAAETIGPQTVQYGSSMVGVYMTATDVATLKRLGGAGGAFSINVLPSDAGTQIPIWDENLWNLTDEPFGDSEWSDEFAP